MSVVEKGCFGDVFDMLVEGEGLVKDDTRITDVREVSTVEPLMEGEKL